jgi:hypothetical protein
LWSIFHVLWVVFEEIVADHESVIILGTGRSEYTFTHIQH